MDTVDRTLQVLGPIELNTRTGPVRLGGPKQLAVLGVLIAGRGEVRSQSSIIMGVWGEDASDEYRSSVHTYVSNLRALLGGVIERKGDGYAIAPDGLTVDAWEFDAEVAGARQRMATDPVGAVEAIRTALGRWRGTPYMEAADAPGLQTEIRRLEELRLDAVELRIEGELSLGHHEALVPELDALVLDHPLRERLRAQHMLALYRSGRQAEALRAFEQARRYLAEELGLEPSPELAALELRILEQDPQLSTDSGQLTTQRLAFLFTDIEGSTALWDLHPQDMAAALRHHDEILAGAIESEGGTVFKHTGDGVLAALSDSPAAARAAEAAQRALTETSWGPIPTMRVRMAIDVGDVDLRAGDYFGPPLNRCARLMGAGHGGQVLLSSSAQDELVAATIEGLQIRQLGVKRLRGLAAPERIGQLVFVGLPADFPPLRLHVSNIDLSERLEEGALPGYEIRDALGTGSFGVVYRAYQPSVGREVAVKVIRPEFAGHPSFIRRFEAEARLVAGLQHPHIVPLVDFWRNAEGAYLVMQLMRGGTLARALASGWDPAATLPLIHQVAAAVAFGHSQGVVHRDIKPHNILLDGAGNAYLSDFGIAARLLDPIDGGQIPYSAPGYRAPEQSGPPTGPPDPRSDIFSLGALAHRLTTGRTPSAGSDDPAAIEGSDGVRSVIATATAPRPEDRYQTVEEFIAALDATYQAAETADLLPVRSTVRNPYKGLAAFGEGDAGDFFGRNELIEALSGAVVRHPVVTVVGPSGSGKSSVVRAGLVPRLRSGAVGSEHWYITDLTPGPRPLNSLAEAIRAVSDTPVADPIGLLTGGGSALTDLVEASISDPDATVLLVVDQLEELYTLAAEQDRDTFIDVLTPAAGPRLRVVATLRADFYDRPLGDPRLGPLVRDGLVTVIPPNREELVEAVERPAAQLGVTFEPGLPLRIAHEVQDQPGALPLLQYALTRLFDERESDRLGAADYEAIGGINGALGRRAEGAFAHLTGPQQSAAREVFLRLVTVDHDTGATRRRIRRSELEALGLPATDLETVLQTFDRQRMLTFDRDPVSRGATVEIAHEALLTAWSRLAEWISDHQEQLLRGRRLRSAVADWEDSGRKPDFLLTGDRLAPFRDLDGLTRQEANFLSTSREAEAADTRAKRRRRRILTGVLAATTAVSLVVGGVALQQRADARRQGQEAEAAAVEAAAQARIATARGLNTNAVALAEEDPELALLLAIEAADLAPEIGVPFEMRGALEVALADTRSIGSLHPSDYGLRFPFHADLSPSGELALIGDHDQLVVVDRRSGEERWRTARADVDWYWDAKFANDDAVVTNRHDSESQFTFFFYDGRLRTAQGIDAVDGLGPRIEFLDARTGSLIDTVELAGCADTHTDLLGRWVDPALRWLVYLDRGPSCGDYGPVDLVVVDLPGGEELHRYRSDAPSFFQSITVGGDRVAWYDAVGGEFVVVDLLGGREIGRFHQPDGNAALSPDGRLLATVAGDGGTSPTVWDVDSGTVIHELAGTDEAFTLWFDDGGGALFTTGENALVRWDLTSGEAAFSETDPVTGVGGGNGTPDGSFAITLPLFGDEYRIWDTSVPRREIVSTAASSVVSEQQLGGRPLNSTLDRRDGAAYLAVNPDAAAGFDVRPIDLDTGRIGDRAATGGFFAVVDRTTIAYQDVTAAGPGPVILHDTDTATTTELAGLCRAEASEGRPPVCVAGTDGIAGDVESLNVTVDRSRLVATVETAGPDFVRRLLIVSWDLQTLEPTVVETDSLATTRAAVLTSTGELFTPPGDLIDLATGATRLLSDRVEFTAGAVLPDGSLLVGTRRGDLVILDPGSWSARREAIGAHQAAVLALAVSADGGTVASIGADGFLVVSEPEGAVRDRIRIDGEPTNVAWLMDGNLLVTTGAGDAYVIDPDTDLIGLARAAVGRELSDRECTLYLGTSCERWEARNG